MKRLLVPAALVALFCSMAAAAPPTDASLEKLLQLTRTEKLVESMIQNVDNLMRTSMAQSLQGQTLSPKGKAIIDALPPRMAVIMQEEMSWQKMKPVYMQVYRESFDQQEIDGLTAFYESATGQAFVAKMPTVMQRSMALTQERMGPMMQRVQQAVQSAVTEAAEAK